VAALVAVAASGQSSSAAEATPGAAASAAPALTDIRAIDFADVAPPGASCDQALRFTPPAHIPVQGGQSAVLDLGRFTRLQVDPHVAYGDLTGDGRAEAVVHVVCNYGANGAQDTVHVWALSRGRLVHVASLREPPRSISGSFPPAVKRIGVRRGQVDVTWTHYAAADPNCCPSQQTLIRYELTGSRLHAVGRPVTSSATA
jgi:hypothetical protein